MLDLNWARIQKFGYYGPIWRPEPYYNFTVELILYGIIFWVVAHGYVERRDRARRTAQLIGEETTSSQHDILTEKRLILMIPVTIIIIVGIAAWTVPCIEADIYELQHYNQVLYWNETILNLTTVIPIPAGEYFSQEMSLPKRTGFEIDFDSTGIVDLMVLTGEQYEVYQKMQRSSLERCARAHYHLLAKISWEEIQRLEKLFWGLNGTSVEENGQVLILGQNYSQSDMPMFLLLISLLEADEESFMIGRQGELHFRAENAGMYWLVLANEYSDTTVHVSHISVTKTWTQARATRLVSVGKKMVTLVEYLFGSP